MEITETYFLLICLDYFMFTVKISNTGLPTWVIFATCLEQVFFCWNIHVPAVNMTKSTCRYQGNWIQDLFMAFDLYYNRFVLLDQLERIFVIAVANLGDKGRFRESPFITRAIFRHQLNPHNKLNYRNCQKGNSILQHLYWVTSKIIW